MENQPTSELATIQADKDKAAAFSRQLVAFIALNLVDLLSTKMILDHGGVEYNPIAQPFVENDLTMIAYKAILAITFVYLLSKLGEGLGSKTLAKNGLMLANLILTYFVVSNMTFFL